MWWPRTQRSKLHLTDIYRPPHTVGTGSWTVGLPSGPAVWWLSRGLSCFSSSPPLKQQTSAGLGHCCPVQWPPRWTSRAGRWTNWLFHVPPCSPVHSGQSSWCVGQAATLDTIIKKSNLVMGCPGSAGSGQKGPGQTHLCWTLMPCLLWRATSVWDCSLTGGRSISAGLFLLLLSGSRTSTVSPTIQEVTMSRTWCPGLIML